MRVLICGSRTWNEWKPIRQYVDALPEGTVVIEGEARGADSIARACAKQRGLEVLPFPAEWQKHENCHCPPHAKFCSVAGPRRNRQMLADGRPDQVAAFVHNLATSTGTRDMVTKARLAGIPVVVHGLGEA